MPGLIAWLLTVAVAAGQLQTNVPSTEPHVSVTNESDISLAGVVTMIDGEPVPDAQVIVWQSGRPTWIDEEFRPFSVPVIAHTQTGPMGRFRIEAVVAGNPAAIAAAFRRGESTAGVYVWAGHQGFASATVRSLPDMPLKLKAIIDVPGAQEERRSVVVKPARNQTDVKIVVDLGEK